MASKVIVLAQGGICRLRLNFRSLVRLSSLVGFCGVVATIPDLFYFFDYDVFIYGKRQAYSRWGLADSRSVSFDRCPTGGVYKFCSLSNSCIPALHLASEAQVHR